jgi:hypothetical protein
MAAVHSKVAVVTVNAVDLSAYCNNVEFGREADSHDTTGFGMSSKQYSGGLKDGTVTLSGVYDSAATGPRLTLEALLGTSTPVVYKAEGTGSGKPVKTVTTIVTKYTETAPVADMISWSAEFQMSGDVVITTGP